MTATRQRLDGHHSVGRITPHQGCPATPTASRERIALGKAGLTVTENAARRSREPKGFAPIDDRFATAQPGPKGRRSRRNLSGKGRRPARAPSSAKDPTANATPRPSTTPQIPLVRPHPARGPRFIDVASCVRVSDTLERGVPALGLLQRLVSACCEDGLIVPALKRCEVRARVDPRLTIGVEPELA
jgi:hypothetical protein